MEETTQAAIEPAKRGRGRLKGFRMTQEHRDKIAKSNILYKLIKCAEGVEEMSPTQASVGVALLKKVLPDLQSVELAGDPDNPLEVVTRVELVGVKSGENSKD